MLRLLLPLIVALSFPAAASDWIPCRILERVNFDDAVESISVMRAADGTVDAMLARRGRNFVTVNFTRFAPGVSTEMFVERIRNGVPAATFRYVTAQGADVRLEAWGAVENATDVSRTTLRLTCPG